MKGLEDMKQLIKNKILLLFVGIIAAGAIIRLIGGEDSFLWKMFGVLDTASAVALATLAFFGYLEYTKQEDKIKIYFEVDTEKVDTGLSILRKNFTRSEVLGILGMIQKDAKNRFDIGYTRKASMLDTLHKIQKGDQDSFVIPVTVSEIKQFDIK